MSLDYGIVYVRSRFHTFYRWDHFHFENYHLLWLSRSLLNNHLYLLLVSIWRLRPSMLLFPQCLSLSCQSHPNRWGCTLQLLDSKRTSPPCIYIQLDIAYWTPMVFLCTTHFSEEINLLIDNQYLPLMHIEYLFRLRHAALPDWQTLQSAFKYSTRSWERYFTRVYSKIHTIN